MPWRTGAGRPAVAAEFVVDGQSECSSPLSSRHESNAGRRLLIVIAAGAVVGVRIGALFGQWNRGLITGAMIGLMIGIAIWGSRLGSGSGGGAGGGGDFSAGDSGGGGGGGE